MCAAHQRVGGQGGKCVQRSLHLCCRAFEKAAAAAREQRVAAEQQRLALRLGAEEGDMTAGVSRHIDDPPGASEQLHAVATLHSRDGLGQGFVGRAPDRGAGGRANGVNAAHMVGMMVGD